MPTMFTKLGRRRSSRSFKNTMRSAAQSVILQFRWYMIGSAFIIGLLFGYILASSSIFSHKSIRSRSSLIHSSHLRIPKDRLPFPDHLLKTYLAEYQLKIDGWFDREILYAVWILTQYQYDHLNVIGGIGEIGVHHGKFTCFLFLMRKYREQTLFAVDVFDNQELNKDGSGKGRKDIFLNSIRKYADIHQNELMIHAGSSLDLNPDLTNDESRIHWWKSSVIGKRGLQFVSIDGGHTSLLTYSDMCFISNSVLNGAVVAVDDITHPGWLGVRDGASRFLAETSKLMTDFQLENELAQYPTHVSLEISERIINATSLTPEQQQRSSCSRLVPFLQYYNKIFLTTPDYYPIYIELLGNTELFANENPKAKPFLEYHALRLTFGNVPIWTDNQGLQKNEKDEIFKQMIEPIWLKEMENVANHQ